MQEGIMRQEGPQANMYGLSGDARLPAKLGILGPNDVRRRDVQVRAQIVGPETRLAGQMGVVKAPQLDSMVTLGMNHAC